MSVARRFYRGLVGADPGSDMGSREPVDAAVHVVSLTAFKLATGLADPKLVLAWLMSAVGAPGAMIGALVPIREAGALLPQLAIARSVQASPLRKLWWSVGSGVQGLAAVGIAASAWLLDGLTAGAAMLAFLAALSLARAACSLSQKDALARTIPKSRRGAVTGSADTLAAAGVLAFGAALAAGVIPPEHGAIAAVVAVAGGLWMIGGLIFLALGEPAAADDAEGPPSLSELAAPLEDAQLRLLVAARGLLAATALAPPFIVLLTQEAGERDLGSLGPLVLASAGAAIVSGYVWGRLADRSSRRTLMLSGVLGAAALGGTALIGARLDGLGGPLGAAAAMFAAQIAYQGVRAGRKLQLIDMVGDDRRARYSAVSNTAVGLFLLMGGGFGWLADAYGPTWTLGAFAAMCLAAIPVAAAMREVQEPAPA